MTWYRLPLGRGSSFDLSRAVIFNGLADLTMQAVRAAANVRDMAAFISDERANDRAVYLSPAWMPWAAGLVARFGGRPCEKPDFRRVDLYLLTGTTDAAARLLGGPLHAAPRAAGTEIRSSAHAGSALPVDDPARERSERRE